MTSEQEGIIGTVQGDIRGAIHFLSKPCMDGVEGIEEARDYLRKARDIVDSALLGSGGPSSKRETVENIIRDLARESSG